MSDPPTSYLGPHIDAPAMASFFTAAAALFRADPRAQLPHAAAPPLFSVTVPTLGVRHGVLAIAGEREQGLALRLFADMSHYDAYQGAADAAQPGQDTDASSHLALTFGAPERLPDGLAAEVSAQGWELADNDACPLLLAVDTDGSARLPNLDELTLWEALARALVATLADPDSVAAAFHGAPRVLRRHSVRTYDGFVEVTLRAPHPEAHVAYDPSRDLLADLLALAAGEGLSDPSTRAPLEDELLRRFRGSPEADALVEVDSDACQLIMALAADHLGATIATLEAPGLRRALFELFPERVRIEPHEAGVVVASARAFYAYLRRALALPHADACLALLDRDAVAKLAAALGNRSLYSPQKAFVMDGHRAGFDMSSPEGIKAWLDASQRTQLAGVAGLGVSIGPVEPPTRPSQNRRKGERPGRGRRGRRR